MKKLVASFFVPILFSCQKKELPVPAYDRGDVVTAQFEMGNDYRNQVWYSLHDDKIVSTNLKTDWDLAFEASTEGMYVFLNGTKAMKVFKTQYSSLNDVKDTVGLGIGGHADMPSGNRDSTAIGDWKSNNTVYIVHAGYTPIGQPVGFYKLKILSEDASHYTFEYASIKSSEIKTGTVYKNDAYNFIAYSLTTDKQLNIEPKKMEYDLCFTQYTHLFYDPLQYYQVTGVLSNSYNTKIAVLKTEKTFQEVEIGDTASCSFSTRRDKIGYDWKSFDLNTNVYTVNTKMCYFVRDNKGFIYKLHFIDFMNSSGLKGYPKIELKKL